MTTDTPPANQADRSAQIVQELVEAMELCMAHGASISCSTLYLAGSPGIVLSLRTAGDLQAYFDSQRAPLTLVHSDGQHRIHARWRDTLITWPSPSGWPFLPEG